MSIPVADHIDQIAIVIVLTDLDRRVAKPFRDELIGERLNNTPPWVDDHSIGRSDFHKCSGLDYPSVAERHPARGDDFKPNARASRKPQTSLI